MRTPDFLPPLRRAARAALAAAALLGCARAAEQDKACLDCHRDRALSMEQDGQPVSLYVDAGQIHGSVHRQLGCTDCHDGIDAKAKPHRASAVPVDCRSCHDDVASSHAFHRDFAAGGAALTPETDCASCHGDHAIGPASGKNSVYGAAKLASACGQCHEEESKVYVASAHGVALAGGKADAPTCLTCHRKPVAEAKGGKLELKRAQADLCLGCHRDNAKVVTDSSVSRDFIASYAQSVHGKALAKGDAKAPTCVDCHGSHEAESALMAGSRVNLRNIPATCVRCHPDQAADYGAGAHGAALRKGFPDAPVCTTCHGEHHVLARNDPNSPVSVRNVSEEVCATCHASLAMNERYGLAMDRVSTFADSYHGLATRGGAAKPVSCSSCHGAHAVLPSSDPHSPVNRANLPRTCGQCHPNANAEFASAPVHVVVSGDGKEPLVYWIATLYVWLIVVVVTGMVVHNGLDFVKKVRRKIAIQEGRIVEEPIPHRLYLRMTVNERLQHGVLVLSFAALVVTGFMLQYPDAWWVSSIRHHIRHLFEWRSLIHRAAGVAMLGAGAWHLAYLAFTRRGRQLFADLLPALHDVMDAIGVLRYNLGLSPSKPKFGRFSYIEKTEYWAMMWGTIVMGATGALLWFENATIRHFTKLAYDASRTVHLYEAILATLAILVWHLYFVIFNPDVYPMNLSWLTGRLFEREMIEDHPLELERIEAERRRKDGESLS